MPGPGGRLSPAAAVPEPPSDTPVLYEAVARAERTLAVTVGPATVALVLVAVAAATATFAVAVAARRTLGWAIACTVVAALLDPLVRLLDRHLPRLLAVVLGLLLAAAVGVGVVGGVLSDLGNQFDRLQTELPRAAAELEASGALGDAAADLRLEERVGDLLDRIRDPRSGLADSAASTASAYFVSGILTIFFLSWGPRMGQSALAQIRDASRRARVRRVVNRAFDRGRRHVLAAVARAAVAGTLIWAICWWEDIPAPIVSGVAVAALSVVPGIGIVVGALPALMLEAGLGTAAGAMRLALVVLVLQAADAVISRRYVTPWSVTVGPAPVVIAMVVGFEIYGVGGALYSTALAVFAIALLDAAARTAPARAKPGEPPPAAPAAGGPKVSPAAGG